MTVTLLLASGYMFKENEILFISHSVRTNDELESQKLANLASTYF